MSNNNGAPDPGLGEVVRITQGLIKLDTSNFGVGNARGEAEATDYTRTLLGEVGLECSVFESDRGRTNLVARWQGANPDAPALLLHGHLDVVPAEPEDWTFDPFGGELRDGEILGRGAVDMKGSNAMMIAAIRQLIRRGERPPRDIVIAMFADEESGGEFGSAWMVKEHPQVFAGVTDAVSEVGGYSIDIAGKRTYLLQTGEKGALWLTLTAEGRPGHGSQLHEDPAIVRLADAVARIGSERWPIELGATTVDLFERVRDLAGLPADSDPESISQATGFGARFITSSIRNVANVTKISGGYKENVVPQRATAFLDVRVLPGQRDRLLSRIRELAGPGVEVKVEMESEPVEHPFSGEIVDRITEILGRHDLEAQLLPYLLPAGTDNKPLAQLGIRGFGFAPLKLPADFDFPSLFHGVDERIPADSLIFGQRVLQDLIRAK